jgi:FKBP-type peptidyl-prolyl cis-trans isomerase
MRPVILAIALLAVGLLPACAADPTPAAVQAFLASHAQMPGVTVRSSGLQVRVIKSGSGRHVAPRDSVQIYYTAKLADGRVVDGTSPGLPAAVDLGATLTGLGEALQTMRAGDHWELTLPPALAFGAKGGGGGGIGPNQALVFDVTVVAAMPAAMGGADQNNNFSITAANGESHAHFTIHP